MKAMVKVSAVLLAVSLLAGGVSEVAYARCGHHAKDTCATEYAACYQDGACLEDGSCDVDGVCQYGGNCAGYDNAGGCYGRHGRSHHAGRSHRSGCHR